jgi:MYXO-CTERM domain-containing protein
MTIRTVRRVCCVAAGLGAILALSTNAWATRGRVKIANNTIVTDRDTLIRGARVSLDIWDETPSQADVDTMKNSRGLNAFHIYAEYADSNKAPGYNATKVDKVVDMADENDLYVVLTIGCGGANGSFKQDFVTKFWDFYAPRYKDRTHVVYEIMNEPQKWSAPYSAATLQMEKDGYAQIRALAPDTHIMMMSYSQPNNASQAGSECGALGISWDNASVAFHTYGIDGREDSALKGFYDALKAKGIAYSCTEPNLTLQAITAKLFERDGISQTYFINVREIANNASSFTSWITSNKICWTPDFGTWPSCSGTVPGTGGTGAGGRSGTGGVGGGGGTDVSTPSDAGGVGGGGGSTSIVPGSGGETGVAGVSGTGTLPASGGQQGVGGSTTSAGLGGSVDPAGGRASGGGWSAGGRSGVANTGGNGSPSGGSVAGGNGNATGGTPANVGGGAAAGDPSAPGDDASQQSGCSCRLGTAPSSERWSLALLIGLGLVARRRNQATVGRNPARPASSFPCDDDTLVAARAAAPTSARGPG